MVDHQVLRAWVFLDSFKVVMFPQKRGLPYIILTARTWKWMVGRCVHFPFEESAYSNDICLDLRFPYIFKSACHWRWRNVIPSKELTYPIKNALLSRWFVPEVGYDSSLEGYHFEDTYIKKHKHTFSNRFPRTKNCPIFGSDERVFHAQRGSTGKRELRVFSRW